ncbi:hypothetical protein Tco_0278567 [Tanacetum coccineum]
MANLKFVDQHNMVAYLEKSDENAEFHQIFWSTATSKTINYVKQIHAIVDGKAVVILESSVRSDLLFDDEDGVTCLTNDEIFENLALMGYEQLSTKLTFQKGNITLLFASMLVQNQAPMGEGSAIPPEPQPTPSTSQPNVSEPQIESLQIETPPTAAPQTKAHQTEVSQIIFHESHIDPILPSPTIYQRQIKTHKRGDSLERAITTDASLDAAQDSDNIFKTQSTVVPNVDIPQGIDTGGSPKRQETMGGGYTPGSDESRMKLDELITLCTKLLKQVLDLEKEKDAQAVEILNLKKRVKKLERKRKSSISHPRRRKYRQVKTSSDDGLDEKDASKQGRRSDKIKPMFKDKDFEELDDHMENVKEETVDAATTGVSTVSAPVSTAGVTISTAEPRTPPTTTTVFDDEDVTMAMAQTLIKMKEHKAKEKGVAITDVEDSSRTVRPVRSITTLQPLPTIDHKDKGKGVLVEKELVKTKRSDQGDLQIQADADLAQRLHEEELAELERRQKERVAQEEAFMAVLYEEYDTIQASIDVDQKKDDSSSKPVGGSRKKTLARKRASEQKSEESAKKQKLEDVAEEQESTKSDEEAAADYEHEKEELRIVNMEDLHVYKIIRADGNTSYHKSLSSMLRKFDRQDLVDLHRLVMKRFEDTTPEGYNLLLWGDLKVMFEPNAEDEIWIEKRYPLIKEMLQKMLNWKLEAKAESTMAFELLNFIKSQLEE